MATRKQRNKPISERFNPRDTIEWHQWMARFTKAKPNDKEIIVTVKRLGGAVRETKRIPTKDLKFPEGYSHELFDL